MGENSVTSRNLVKLFLTTLGIGGLTAAIVGFIVRWNEFLPYFTGMKILAIVTTTIWLIGMGFLFSVVSQMGFFAYLTIHRFGLGIFKSALLWNRVQLVLIMFALFDIVYFRYETFAKAGDSLIPYLIPAITVFIFGLIVAWFKMKGTKKEAFIPALFFMIVATIVEWVPALKVNKSSWVYLMMFTLLACNTYQVLILHKLNAQSEQHRKTIAESVPKS